MFCFMLVCKVVFFRLVDVGFLLVIMRVMCGLRFSVWCMVLSRKCRFFLWVMWLMNNVSGWFVGRLWWMWKLLLGCVLNWVSGMLVGRICSGLFML